MLKVGDKVRVRDDLDIGMDYVEQKMLKYAGRETIIIAPAEYKDMWKLEVDGEQFFWSNEMLEKVETGGNDMTAVEYFKTKSRMVKVDNNGGCTIRCTDCAIGFSKNGENQRCTRFENLHAKKAIEIVQKWGEEHPVKTYLSDFLEKYPHAPLNKRGEPKCCIGALGYIDYEAPCIHNCAKCWNQEMEETK